MNTKESKQGTLGNRSLSRVDCIKVWVALIFANANSLFVLQYPSREEISRESSDFESECER